MLTKEERDNLVLDNKGIAFKLATKFLMTNPHLDKDDAVQTAMVGLVRAANNWDPAKALFSTLAWHCVLHELVGSLQTSRVIKLHHKAWTYEGQLAEHVDRAKNILQLVHECMDNSPHDLHDDHQRVDDADFSDTCIKTLKDNLPADDFRFLWSVYAEGEVIGNGRDRRTTALRVKRQARRLLERLCA